MKPSISRVVGAAILVIVELLWGKAPAAAAVPLRFAFTQHFNISLMDVTGGGRQAVTTRGTNPSARNPISYPWYQWSPDGQYLLLLRKASAANLLLLNPKGVVVRTLATAQFPADFNPSWAIDADRIVFVASSKPASGGAFQHTVKTVDVHGHQAFGWNYRSVEGCGGAAPDPAASMYWAETGLGGVAPSMQWSIGQHLAIYSQSCRGGLNLTDTRTGVNRPLGLRPATWNEASLSTLGTLAVTTQDCNSIPNCDTRIVLINTHSGAIVRTVGRGELPSWSRDGSILYFVQRTKSKILRLMDSTGRVMEIPTYNSAVWRANASGLQPRKLVHVSAYGFGPITTTNQGRTILFSRVDNDTNLWRHRLRNGSFTPRLLALYGPTVRIERLDAAGMTTLVAAAGQPVAQP